MLNYVDKDSYGLLFRYIKKATGFQSAKSCIWEPHIGIPGMGAIARPGCIDKFPYRAAKA